MTSFVKKSAATRSKTMPFLAGGSVENKAPAANRATKMSAGPVVTSTTSMTRENKACSKTQMQSHRSIYGSMGPPPPPPPPPPSTARRPFANVNRNAVSKPDPKLAEAMPCQKLQPLGKIAQKVESLEESLQHMQAQVLGLNRRIEQSNSSSTANSSGVHMLSCSEMALSSCPTGTSSVIGEKISTGDISEVELNLERPAEVSVSIVESLQLLHPQVGHTMGHRRVQSLDAIDEALVEIEELITPLNLPPPAVVLSVPDQALDDTPVVILPSPLVLPAPLSENVRKEDNAISVATSPRRILMQDEVSQCESEALGFDPATHTKFFEGVVKAAEDKMKAAEKLFSTKETAFYTVCRLASGSGADHAQQMAKQLVDLQMEKAGLLTEMEDLKKQHTETIAKLNHEKQAGYSARIEQLVGERDAAFAKCVEWKTAKEHQELKHKDQLAQLKVRMVEVEKEKSALEQQLSTTRNLARELQTQFDLKVETSERKAAELEQKVSELLAAASRRDQDIHQQRMVAQEHKMQILRMTNTYEESQVQLQAANQLAETLRQRVLALEASHSTPWMPQPARFEEPEPVIALKPRNQPIKHLTSTSCQTMPLICDCPKDRHVLVENLNQASGLITQLRGEAEMHQMQISQLNEALNLAKTREMAFGQHTAALEANDQQQKTDNQKQIQSLTKRLSVKTEECNVVSAQLLDAKQKLNETIMQGTREIDTLKNDLLQRSAALQTNQKILDDIKAKMTSLQALEVKASGLEKQVAEARQVIAHLQSLVAEKEAAEGTLREQVSGLKSRLEVAGNQYMNTQEQFLRSKSTNENMQKELAQSEASVAHLKSELQKAIATVEQNSSEIEESKRAKQTLQIREKELSDLWQRYLNETKHMSQQIQGFQQMAAQHHAEVQRLSADRHVREAMEIELEQCRTAKALLADNQASLERENEDLKTRMKQAEDRMRNSALVSSQDLEMLFNEKRSMSLELFRKNVELEELRTRLSAVAPCVAAQCDPATLDAIQRRVTEIQQSVPVPVFANASNELCHESEEEAELKSNATTLPFVCESNFVFSAPAASLSDHTLIQPQQQQTQPSRVQLKQQGGLGLGSLSRHCEAAEKQMAERQRAARVSRIANLRNAQS